MLDRITLFGSRGGKLQPSRNGDGASAWMAVSPQPIGAVDLQQAAAAVRRDGGLIITASQTAVGVDIQTHAAGSYQPPDKALLLGDAGPSWVEISGMIALPAGERLVVPEDRAAQDGVENLRNLIEQLPEDRQGLIWSALSRPDAHYRLSRLEEQVRELRQAAPAASAPASLPPVQQKPGANWLLAAAGTLLGLVLGFGAATFLSGDAAAPPEKAAKTEPAAEPLPVLTVTDLERLDRAIQESPKKDRLLAFLGPDASLMAMNQAGFVALAKLELHKSAVEGLDKMDAAQVVAKLGEIDLGASRTKLLAQYVCDSHAADIELPDSFPGCAESRSVNDIRQAYFNLLDFVAEKPAP